jgi:hypothetical protein
MVARTLRELGGEFGEIRVSDADNPSVEINLIGVNTSEILQQVIHVDDDAARRRLIKTLLVEDFKITDRGEFTTTCPIAWKGTERIAELVFANVRDPDLADAQFEPELPGAIRVIIDYPFDEANYWPSDDRHRVQLLRDRLDRPQTMVWLPSFLSGDRLADLADLVKIRYVLDGRVRLDELTPYLSLEDRHHARTVLESRKSALTTRLRDALRRAYGLASPDDADLGAPADEHLMALDSQLQVRPPAGLGFADALIRICGQVLGHAYPRHPDFDPNGQGKIVKRTDLSLVLGAVERAAQDKVGRLEVPATDLPVLRRIANPLEIATVGEVFVLRDDWKLRIERHAASAGPVTDLKVGDIRAWIVKEQPGLPPLVTDLLVCCFAVQSDRAWMRGGQSMTQPPELGKLSPDMVLRRQELPDEDEFATANDRAAAIFGLARQPVRSARSVQALADEVRRRAGALLPAAESLVTQIGRHTATLGLDETSPRLVTARATADLANRLTGLTDATALLRALADAHLSRDGVIYRASLTTARELADQIAALRWEILDRTAALGVSDSPDAERAAVITDELRAAARRDEHEIALGNALRMADAAATKLMLDIARQKTQTPNSGGGSSGDLAGTVTGEPGGQTGQEGQHPGAGQPWAAPSDGSGTVQRRASASEVHGVVNELLAEADSHPDAMFEITWRIVAP